MDFEGRHNIGVEELSPPDLDHVSTKPLLHPVMVVSPIALAVSACGGGTETAASPSAAAPPVPAPPPSPPPTMTQSSRFLAQASMGATDADIAAVVSQGIDGWLGSQFSMTRATTFWDWLVSKGYTTPINYSRDDGFDAMIWNQLITGKDQLRQRVGVALMSMLVVGIDGVYPLWRQFSMASYMDVLWENAFGNYRTLLEKISTSTVMGRYLTFQGSKKANGQGAMPDENYARELMQLFTIGLYQLNLDGTQKLTGGKPIETYTQADIVGLARVFTGWQTDENSVWNAFDHSKAPMVQYPADHELGEKTFLGTTIPAGTDGVKSLKIALDTLFAHPNVAPFVCKQLIQHLVTSNPTPAYVQRVATVFENNGSGVRGDLRSVIRAILMDVDARNDAAAVASTTFGKVREPLLRFTGWARAFNATSPSEKWQVTTGQNVGQSPSVFNYFRPGYVPPGSALAAASLVGPEFQIINEVTVPSYINFILVSLRDGWGDVKGEYSEFVAKAADSQGLLDLINLRLAANQVSPAAIAQIKTAVDSISSATPADLLNRVYTAAILIMASPEYIILK